MTRHGALAGIAIVAVSRLHAALSEGMRERHEGFRATLRQEGY